MKRVHRRLTLENKDKLNPKEKYEAHMRGGEPKRDLLAPSR